MFNKAHVLPVPGGRRGFTIVEIVMAFIIIGILTLVLTPALTNHAANARINACRSELKALADAEERACIDTGYLFRPYVLNDVRGGDTIANAPQTLPTTVINRINGIRDNGVETGNLYKNPSWIFISPTSGTFLTNQVDLFMRLAGSTSGDLNMNPGSETRFNWNGPYVNWQHDEMQIDWPQDPWGNPYLFFTRAGVIYPPMRTESGVSTGANSTDVSFAMQTNGPQSSNGTSYPAVNVFDRPTWLSLGPNGVPGSGTTNTNDPEYGYGKGDDLIYTFGGN